MAEPPERGEEPPDGSTAEPTGTEDRTRHTTDRRTLAGRVQLYWAVRLLVAALIVGALAGLAARWVGADPRLGPAISAVLAALGLVWIRARYRVWNFRVREDALYLERGVFTHVRTVAPHVRIQHVDTSRGPLERALGLSTLVVYTAGSRGADVSIPGLTPEEAADLQGRVKQLAIEAEGGDAL